MSGAKVAVVGIGTTEQGEIPGQSGDEIAVRAAAKALADAGIDKSQLDGLVTCKPPGANLRSGVDEDLGQLLGINPAFSSTLEYGACGFSVHLAAMAIQSGLAGTVLLMFGSANRSQKADFGKAIASGGDWARYNGLFHIAGQAALAFRQHQHRYGTTEEQLGWIAVSQREWAVGNPRAIFRDPMTIDDYLAQKYIAAPLRRSDLTMISDGGVAFILTTAERAKDFPHPPVYLLGMAQDSGMRGEQNPDRLQRPWIKGVADKLWTKTGLGPKDMQAAYLQDATSVWVLQQLEWFGFCGLGEGGPYLAEGHHRPGGDLPVNTGGGQLSESYMWNWLAFYEAVEQLRGDAGDRQLPRHETYLHSQTHDFWRGAATILATREEP